MRRALLILFLCSLALAQSIIAGKATIGAKATIASGVAGSSVTVNFGGTGTADAGQAGDPALNSHVFWAPMILSASNPTLIPTCYVVFLTAQPGSWSCAIYGSGSTAGLVDGGSLVCNSSTQSNGATLAAYTSIALNSCPSTLTGAAGTIYWVGVTYTSTTVQVGATGISGHAANMVTYGTIPVNGIWSSGTITPWPATAPASTSTPVSGHWLGPYSIYVQASYNSTNPYDIISVNQADCDVSVPPCTGAIATTQSGHGFLAMAINSGDGNTVSSVKTLTNGSVTDTLTQVGCATAGNNQWCFYWKDRVTAGANGIQCNFTGNAGGSYKLGCHSLEISGTASSNAVDQSHFDSALINGASFTSGSTGTTTQANELLIGGDIDSWPGATGTLFYITPTAPWTTPDLFASSGNAPSQQGIFARSVTSTGTYNIGGTSNGGAGSNNHLPGIVTLKLGS